MSAAADPLPSLFARAAAALAGVPPPELTDGVTAFVAARGAAVVDDLDALIEATPDSAAADWVRGEALAALDRLAAACDELRYAADLDESAVAPLWRLAEFEVERDRPAEAADAWDAVADRGLDDVHVYAALGEALLDADEPTRAVAAFEEGLALAPGDARLLAGRAAASLALDLDDDALQDAEAAVRSDGDALEAWETLARVRLARGEAEAARDAIDRLLALSPRHPEGLRLRGDARWDAGDVAGAVADYTAALAAEPDDVETRIAAAEGQLRLGDAAAALASAARALALDDGDADAIAFAARAEAALGRRAKARARLDAALDRTDAPAVLYHTRGELHAHDGQPNLAWRDARLAIDADPDFGPAYVLRARMALELETADEALADLDAAVELDEKDGEALAWRGLAHQRAGHRADAERDWAAADAALPPGHPLRAELSRWRA